MSRDPAATAPCAAFFASIMVPAYNCAHFLDGCLGALFAQTYLRDRYEIIVVDDGSTDGTAERARELGARWEGKLVVIWTPNGGPASARNAGIRASQADAIAFTDSDCIASPDWLEHLVATLVSSDAAGVGGLIVNVVPPGWVSDYLTSGRFFRHRVRRGRVDYLLTANVAVRSPALLAMGGFSEQQGAWSEDADLSFRLRQAGYTLVVTQQGAVTHYGTPASLRGLVKNLYRYGRGNSILSRNWSTGRTPAVELMRHAGAIAVAPWIALSRARRVGPWRALSFWPLVVLEHGAFMVGLLSGMVGTMIAGGKRGG